MFENASQLPSEPTDVRFSTRQITLAFAWVSVMMAICGARVETLQQCARVGVIWLVILGSTLFWIAAHAIEQLHSERLAGPALLRLRVASRWWNFPAMTVKQERLLWVLLLVGMSWAIVQTIYRQASDTSYPLYGSALIGALAGLLMGVIIAFRFRRLARICEKGVVYNGGFFAWERLHGMQPHWLNAEVVLLEGEHFVLAMRVTGDERQRLDVILAEKMTSDAR